MCGVPSRPGSLGVLTFSEPPATCQLQVKFLTPLLVPWRFLLLGKLWFPVFTSLSLQFWELTASCLVTSFWDECKKNCWFSVYSALFRIVRLWVTISEISQCWTGSLDSFFKTIIDFSYCICKHIKFEFKNRLA